MKLPNDQLLNRLVETYWENDPSPDQGIWISSYWRLASGEFRIERLSDGELVSLTGPGLGTLNRGGLARRFLENLCIDWHLLRLSNKRDILKLRGRANQLIYNMGLHPTLDVFRQVCTLALIQRHVSSEILAKRIHFLMIGDGYGVLSALVKSVFPNSTIALVDIGKSLLFQAYYCQRAFPESSHQLAGEDTSLEDTDFVYCPAEYLERLEDFGFEVAANVASMQEMNVPTIERYFDFLRRNLRSSNLFYCCNRESKTLIGGEVASFQNYPWSPDDQHLIDELCPWQQYYFDSRPVIGVRIPWVNYYDGPVRHRLTVMANEALA